MQHGKVVDGIRDVQIVRPLRLLADRQRALRQWYRLLIFAGVVECRHFCIERGRFTQLCRGRCRPRDCDRDNQTGNDLEQLGHGNLRTVVHGVVHGIVGRRKRMVELPVTSAMRSGQGARCRRRGTASDNLAESDRPRGHARASVEHGSPTHAAIYHHWHFVGRGLRKKLLRAMTIVHRASPREGRRLRTAVSGPQG
jgi:hypothetical protein